MLKNFIDFILLLLSAYDFLWGSWILDKSALPSIVKMAPITEDATPFFL